MALVAIETVVTDGTVSAALMSLYATYGITKDNLVEQSIKETESQTKIYITYDDGE